MTKDPKNNDPPRSVLQWRTRERIDGKPRGLPRGRHAKKRGEDDDGEPPDDAPREAAAVPVHQRLGFRPAEFAALVGVSYVTVWRGIKSGKVKTIEHMGVTIIPRAYVVEAGYISPDDTGI